GHAGITHARGIVDQKARGFDFSSHFRQLELHTLKVTDGLAKLLALTGVGDGVIERATRQANHLRANGDPAFVERLDGDLVPLAHFTHHVLARHAAIVENQLARGRRAEAQLVLLFAYLEAGKAALDEKRS